MATASPGLGKVKSARDPTSNRYTAFPNGVSTLTIAYDPWNFTLSCNLQNKNSVTPQENTQADRVQSLHDDHGETTNASTGPPKLMNVDDISCCSWGDTDDHCSQQFHSMEPESMNWITLCWTDGNLEHLVCHLKPTYKKTYFSGICRTKYIHNLSELTVEELPVKYQKKSLVVVNQQSCLGHDNFECIIPSVKLNYTYFMWMEITTNAGMLQSPLMSIMPIDIVKPNPPLNLQGDITNEGLLRINWTTPDPLPYELQYEVKYSINSTDSTWQIVKVVMDTSLQLGSVQLGFLYLAQVRCKRLLGLGFWSNWSTPYKLDAREVIYFPPRVLASAGSSVTISCLYNNKSGTVKDVDWWLNLAVKIPENQYTIINDHIASVTVTKLNATKNRGKFHYDALYCCHRNGKNITCNHHYAEIHVIDVKLNISCETDGNLTHMTCKWNPNTQNLPIGSSFKLKYYRNNIYCPSSQESQHNSDFKDCHLQRNKLYECIFQPISLFSGYIMWVEIYHYLGKLESSPTCVIPMDVVKPLPPTSVEANITKPDGQLNVTWEIPKLPEYDLQFQIRYSKNGKEKNWKTQDVVMTSSGIVEVSNPCTIYIVQVRCTRYEGPGYWSAWSGPAYTTVYDLKTPEKGPDFWRVINEDPLTKVTNVTLLWQPVEVLCTVKGFRIQYQTSKNVTWTEHSRNETSYTFTWMSSIHTVSILVFNSIGSSTVNYNLTLSKQTSTVQVVQSLHAYLSNSSCVILSWNLLPGDYLLSSFIIEWKILNEKENIKWIRVPSDFNKFPIKDHFPVFEKYQFTLYPILSDGVAQPLMIDEFFKGEREKIKSDGSYIVLPIIISSLILLFGTLLVSQQRMRKLLWEDVPNPQNCSWAQGVNFQKPETLDDLFVRPHGKFAISPFLPATETVSEAFSIEKIIHIEQRKGATAFTSICRKNHEIDADSACFSSFFNSDSIDSARNEKAYPESTGQSNIKYATILNISESSELCEQQKGLSSTHAFGNIPSSDSDISCNQWESEKQITLQLEEIKPIGINKITFCSSNSSEGFSEPSNEEENDLEEYSPERNLCYLGLTSNEEEEKESLMKADSNISCQFQTNGQFNTTEYPEDNTLSNFDSIFKVSLNIKLSPKKNMRSYMPQFQIKAAKI
ncbi:leptin receptor [Latimeria chalumnae]|uniref:leptin receptor n=1 Tax=Latimeria chalumnae TaxID=7897 RepID=UPI00313E5987